VVGGVATFAGLVDDTAESITLKFESGSLTPAVSGTVVVSPAVDLMVSSFTAAPEPVVAGANLTYTAVVTNNGPSPATSVALTSPLGATVSYVSLPHHTVVSGTVRKVRGDTGLAFLGSTIWGLGSFGDVRVKLASPPFQIGLFPFSPGSAALTAARPMISLSAVGAKTSSRESFLSKAASRGKSTSVAKALNRPFHAFHR
jgi:uncharacterized repeat protein (TIGR01451 family)